LFGIYDIVNILNEFGSGEPRDGGVAGQFWKDWEKIWANISHLL
jgi:hypothetical protein